MLPSDVQPQNPLIPNSILVGALCEVMQDSVHSTCSARAACHSANIKLGARGCQQHVCGADGGFSAATVLDMCFWCQQVKPSVCLYKHMPSATTWPSALSTHHTVLTSMSGILKAGRSLAVGVPRFQRLSRTSAPVRRHAGCRVDETM